MSKGAHHTGPYQVTARRIKSRWMANPLAVCCRCGRTIDQHASHHDGKPARWTAEHTIPGSTTWTEWTDPLMRPPAGDWLAGSASTCNFAAQDTPVEPHTVTTRSW